MIRFSYVVLFHNNTNTDRVVDSILEQFLDGEEIIIVDDHSDKQSLNMFDRFGSAIQIVHTDIAGNRGYNRNFGAKFTKNEHILFVDGDIIFLPNAIMSMRESMEKGFVGAVGNVVCSQNTLPQMNLLTGQNYINLICDDQRWEHVARLNLLLDRRQQDVFEKAALDCVWEYFYSAYVAVQRKAFFDVGEYETRFVGWGVEDDEFGYRLHLRGKLEYNMSAYGIHAPHMRNLYQCLVSNRINLYRFLAKYPTNEIECHMTVGNNLKVNCVLDKVRQRITAAKLPKEIFPFAKRSVYVHVLTQQHPNGNIVFTNDEKQQSAIELLGLALPFRNKNFESAVCSENLFAYPECLATQILSEMLRVAREVQIMKVAKPHRILWSEEENRIFRSNSFAKRIVYSSYAISDFDIIDQGDRYCIQSGIAEKMNDHLEVAENFYMPSFFAEKPHPYILLNLTGEHISKEQQGEIARQNGIHIDGYYEVDPILPQKKIQLSHILAGDLYRLHTPIIYLIPEGYELLKTDKWWDFPFRQRDLICQKT